MSKELIKITKHVLGYTEETASCKQCKYSEEKENPHLDRDWFLICKFNNLISFQVNAFGRCIMFEKRSR